MDLTKSVAKGCRIRSRKSCHVSGAVEEPKTSAFSMEGDSADPPDGLESAGELRQRCHQNDRTLGDMGRAGHGVCVAHTVDGRYVNFEGVRALLASIPAQVRNSFQLRPADGQDQSKTMIVRRTMLGDTRASQIMRTYGYNNSRGISFNDPCLDVIPVPTVPSKRR
ncbi:hypothetical protein ACLOJK_013824 [Asimina triloba]